MRKLLLLFSAALITINVWGQDFTVPVNITTNEDALLNFNNTDDSWQYMQFKWSGVRKAWLGLSSGNDFLISKNDGGDIAFMNANIGIGTTSPDAKLHINVNNVGIKSQYANGILEGTDAQFDITSSSDGTWGSAINFIEGNGSTNTDLWSIVRQTTNGSGNSSLRFNYGTLNNHTNPTKMTLNTDGKIGIGTTSPSDKLHIVPIAYGANQDGGIELSDAAKNWIARMAIKSTSTGASRFAFDWGGSEVMALRGGKVGIGTSSPDSRLDVASEYGDGYLFDTDFNTDQTKMFFKESNSNIFSIYYDGSESSPNNKLFIRDEYFSLNIMTFEQQTGNVGIGVSNPEYKLTVDGTIGAREVIVTNDAWADFVFEPDYNLMSLKDLDNFIQENKHLPEIPATQEVEENGISIGEMNAKLLQKIEELTLYTIQQQEVIETLTERIEQLENK